MRIAQNSKDLVSYFIFIFLLHDKAMGSRAIIVIVSGSGPFSGAEYWQHFLINWRDVLHSPTKWWASRNLSTLHKIVIHRGKNGKNMLNEVQMIISMHTENKWSRVTYEWVYGVPLSGISFLCHVAHIFVPLINSLHMFALCRRSRSPDREKKSTSSAAALVKEQKAPVNAEGAIVIKDEPLDKVCDWLSLRLCSFSSLTVIVDFCQL